MSQTPDVLDLLQEWMQLVMKHSMHGFIRYSKDTGLSMSQFGALFQIHRSKICGVTDIGTDLGVSSAAASQMLDRLVQQGLVERIEDPEDRRGKRLSLTDKGMKMVQEGIYARQEWMKTLSASLSDSEKEIISAALALLVEKAKNINSAPRGANPHEIGAIRCL